MQDNERAERRKELMSQIGECNAAVLFSAKEECRNGDVDFPFRQNSDFYYYTGFNEPDAVALFLPGRQQGQYVLFNRARDAKMEIWVGPRAGQEGACQVYGADQSFDINELDKTIMELLQNRQQLFYPLGKDMRWDRKICSWVSFLQKNYSKKGTTLWQLADIRELIAEKRIIKNEQEISRLRQAATISASAHAKVMQMCQPGMFEYELEALFEYEVKRNGCRAIAYPTIVGGGENACILHYAENKHVLKSGDLVLIDAGGEFDYYAADITRTFPVNGKFTPTQAAIYQLVLDAQLSIISAIKPGLPWASLQQQAVEILTKGLIQLGIIPGPYKVALENKIYQAFYMHNIGHWLGLDVHDVGSYFSNGESRKLEAGMVLTVEPGLYFPPSDSLDEKWWNIGIRIEDDVLVTAKGAEVLTADAPKEIKAIENIMTGK